MPIHRAQQICSPYLPRRRSRSFSQTDRNSASHLPARPNNWQWLYLPPPSPPPQRSPGLPATAPPPPTPPPPPVTRLDCKLNTCHSRVGLCRAIELHMLLRFTKSHLSVSPPTPPPPSSRPQSEESHNYILFLVNSDSREYEL